MSWIDSEVQIVAEKLRPNNPGLMGRCFVSAPKHKVIPIAHIAQGPECGVHELIELIEVDIGKYLARQITDRDATRRASGSSLVAGNDGIKQLICPAVRRKLGLQDEAAPPGRVYLPLLSRDASGRGR